MVDLNLPPDAVSGLCWDPASQYLVSAGGGDRHVRVWHNHPGRRVHLAEMKAELPKAYSDAIKVYNYTYGNYYFTAFSLLF